MVFVDENRRAGRSPSQINLKNHTIIYLEHRTKTPRMKEKEKKKENLGTAHPPHQRAQGLHKPFGTPHSDEPLSFARLRGSAENFSLEKLEGKSHFFL